MAGDSAGCPPCAQSPGGCCHPHGATHPPPGTVPHVRAPAVQPPAPSPHRDHMEDATGMALARGETGVWGRGRRPDRRTGWDITAAPTGPQRAWGEGGRPPAGGFAGRWPGHHGHGGEAGWLTDQDRHGFDGVWVMAWGRGRLMGDTRGGGRAAWRAAQGPCGCRPGSGGAEGRGEGRQTRRAGEGAVGDGRALSPLPCLWRTYVS